MALRSGTRLGPYEIGSSLGAGAMGEVYRARDPRLGRDVAIKVLPASFANDDERLRRFEREARAASALNHPGILTIYDIGLHEGVPFVVSELLDGQSLRERIGGSALPVRKAIDYAAQLARGLAAAHAKDIVHRDLKPENVFVTSDGRIKILDFGLAKLTEAIHHVEVEPDALTRKVNTDPGAVMGTVGYMAPEQVRAQRVDHRSDIFALGLILYEMLSGKRAFRGNSAVETLNAILKEDPPQLSESNSHINPALERVVLHCLEKNPAHRFQSTGDVAFALESLSALSSNRTLAEELTSAVPRRNTRAWLPWVIAAALLLGLMATLPFAVAYLRRSPTEEGLIRLSVSLPDKVLMSEGTSLVAISPDGRQIAFVATREGQNLLWVRSLDSFTPKPLVGMEISGSPGFPFWSPDSRFIGFFAGDKLKKVEASGGPPQTLCDLPAARGGTWNRDGVILVGTVSGTLFRVSQAGGELTPLTTLDQSRFETSHRWPDFLPDGRHFLFFVRSAKVENTGIYAGSLDSKETRQLLPNVLSALYAPPGFLLFLRNDTLMAQPFDTNALKLTGEPFPIAEQVGFNSGLGRGDFSVSENGVLAFRTGGGRIDQPLWFDRTGKQTGTVAEAGMYSNIALSPVDEKQAAFDRTDPQTGTRDIWLFDLARNGVSSRFTTDPAVDHLPLWSPDAKRIVFSSNRTGGWNLYEKSASGGESEEVILNSVEGTEPDDWSRDGKFIIYASFNGKTKWDLWLLRTADKNASPLLQSEFNEKQASFSPDGKYIAYTSDKSGSPAVYVQTFPLSGSEWRISTDVGAQPRWRSDGRELFYIGPDRKLMVVDVKLGPPFQVGVPKPLFDTRVPTITDIRNHYAVTADGQHFLINSMTEQRGPIIDVVKNWTTLMKR